MKFADRIIRTFEHKPIDKVVWQPRIMYWYRSNKIHSLTPTTYPSVEEYVPKNYIGKSITEIYDDLDASIRYPAETLNIPLFYQQMNRDAQIERHNYKKEDGTSIEIIKTPMGEVSQASRNGYQSEHLVKKIEDLKVVKYLVENTEFHFNPLMYEAAVEELEAYGIPTTYYFRSPYMRCILEYLGFEKTIIFLRRYKNEMEDFLQFLDHWDEQQYDNVITKCPLKLLNFGENIDHNLAPPKYFEKYLLPYYENRVKKLHNVNKFAFIHIDGSYKDLLPFLPTMPFDGYEALTPPPQGDVTIKELYNTLADSGKIVLDVIPATLFMKQFDESKLIEKTNEILDLFAPNIILGISDELCLGDGRRLKTVSNIVEKFEV